MKISKELDRPKKYEEQLLPSWCRVSYVLSCREQELFSLCFTRLQLFRVAPYDSFILAVQILEKVQRTAFRFQKL